MERVYSKAPKTMCFAGQWISLTDLFGVEPEHFHVHHGDVMIERALFIEDVFDPGPERDTVHIVEGDL